MPQADIGWDHAQPHNGNKRNPKCNYCGKVLHGGITRLKQHLAAQQGEVAACTKVSKNLMLLMQEHLRTTKSEKLQREKKKGAVLDSLREEVEYGYGTTQYQCDSDEDDLNDPRFHGMDSQEVIDMQFAMRDSRRQATIEEDMRRRSFSQGTSSGSGTGYGPPRSSSRREMPPRSSSMREMPQSRREVEDRIKRIDPAAFPSRASSQKNLKTSFLKDNVKKVGRAIGKFFLFNAIPFHAADSGPFYQTMIDTIGDIGKGVKGPSGRQIAGYILEEEIEELQKYITDLNKKWPIYGCTIMCDGWSSRNKYPIVNFMVYCKGDMIFHKSVDTSKQKKTSKYIYSLMKKVVEEVGKENVVQIVTDNDRTYKAAGGKLMTKYPNLVWSPCAAHCIDLMLEDISEIPSVASSVRDARKITSFIYNSDQYVTLMRTYTKGRELLRPGITRFATEFIAMESLIRHQHELKQLFASPEWNDLSYVRRKNRRDQATEVSRLVLSDQFWKRAMEVTTAMEPLVMVLKIVDQERKPTLPVVYDAMDRAKIGIKDSKIKEWKKIWEIIDSRWERQLHCHIHAAAYFLNPMSRYGTNFTYDDEVRIGLKETITRLEPNEIDQAKALSEEAVYSERRGSFGTRIARTAITIQSPADWWFHHGEDAPHLRKIAIKVLSQTCSSSSCERNWSTFSLIHTKVRNRLAMEKLEKLVFVHYNLRLRVRGFMHKPTDDNEYCPIDLNHIFNDQDILDPWITEVEAPVIDGRDNEWLNDESQPQEIGERSSDDDEDDDDVSTDDGSGGNRDTTSGNGGNDDDDYGGTHRVRTNDGNTSYTDRRESDGSREPTMYGKTYNETFGIVPRRERSGQPPINEYSRHSFSLPSTNEPFYGGRARHSTSSYDEGYSDNRHNFGRHGSYEQHSESSFGEPTGYEGWMTTVPSNNYDRGSTWSTGESSQSEVQSADYTSDAVVTSDAIMSFGRQLFGPY